MTLPRTITTDWVETAPLDTVCLALASQLQKGQKPAGELLAHLVRRLIALEVQPGGPYYSNDTVDFATNLAIAYFFAWLKKPLPGLSQYIETQRPGIPLSSPFQALLKEYDARLLTLSQPAPDVDAPSRHAIYAQAKDQLSLVSEPLKTTALTFLGRIKRADKNSEISLLPSMFYNSLLSPFSFPPTAILGEANVYTWIAYTIYDHLLDDEPLYNFLPAANLAHRLSLARYQAIFPPNHSFHQKVATIFTTMDNANAWELDQCRFVIHDDMLTITTIPSFGRCEILADRSSGHILGPLAIAHLATTSLHSLQYAEKGLRHYLIARQLSDDLHDWQQDIRRGHATAATSHILKHAKIKPGTYAIDTLVARMQSHFWNHSMESLTTSLTRHTNLSRNYLLKSRLLKEEGEIFTLLKRLESIATSSLREHQRYKDFAKTYQQLSRH